MDQIDNGTQWIRMTTVGYTMDQNDNGTVHNGSE